MIDQLAIAHRAQADGYELTHGGYHDWMADNDIAQCEICNRYGDYGSEVQWYDHLNVTACEGCTAEVWGWVGPEKVFAVSWAPLGYEEQELRHWVAQRNPGYDVSIIHDWGYKNDRDGFRRFNLTAAQLRALDAASGRLIGQDGHYGYRYFPDGRREASGRLNANTMRALIRKGALIQAPHVAGEPYQIEERLHYALEARRKAQGRG